LQFSVVIPALNEGELIAGTIRSCQAAGASEIIVCDGGSRDDTVAIARRLGCVVLSEVPGRGRQLAAGARRAKGHTLVFVHADTRLSRGCLRQIEDHLASCQPADAWGGFRQRIDASGWRYRWLERGNAWRASWRQLVYGDQAMWITQNLYQRVGGFAEVPLMEDVMICDQLKLIVPPALLPGPIHLSPRHWQGRGVTRTTLRNWYLFHRFRRGVTPTQLARRYRSH
jgi:rSAM/selenodomain-associated transferase 2